MGLQRSVNFELTEKGRTSHEDINCLNEEPRAKPHALLIPNTSRSSHLPSQKRHAPQAPPHSLINAYEVISILYLPCPNRLLTLPKRPCPNHPLHLPKRQAPRPPRHQPPQLSALIPILTPPQPPPKIKLSPPILSFVKTPPTNPPHPSSLKDASPTNPSPTLSTTDLFFPSIHIRIFPLCYHGRTAVLACGLQRRR